MRGLVLRRTVYRDADLIIDLLTEEQGRLSAIARGARRSKRRFVGALEIGTLLDVQLSQRVRGLPTLTSCAVKRALKTIRTDLDRINQLAYVLEIARLTAPEGDSDSGLLALVDGYIRVLEAAPASHEGLAYWELSLLGHLGYRLDLARCVRTGRVPNGLSLQAGGAVWIEYARQAGDALPLSAHSLRCLSALANGDVTARFNLGDRGPVRRAFAHIWTGITGRTLRTAPFLLALEV